jgi:hypothetical protein
MDEADLQRANLWRAKGTDEQLDMRTSMRRPKLSSRRGGRDDTTRWLPVPCFHPHFR